MLKSVLASVAALSILACSGPKADAQSLPPAPFTLTDVASFNEPWAMVFLPDGRALVTEKAGKLQLWDGKGTGVVTVSGTPKVAYGGQGGFGDVILHPQFAKNKMVYLSWAEAGKGGYGAVVGRAKLVEDKKGARLEGLSVIWRAFPYVSGRGHFGHRLAFGPDQKLYIATGERQKFDPAQDMTGNLGKMLRLNEDGSVPADNPFAAKGGVTAQIWSLGLRNPLGIAFDAAGRLWEVEMGPKGGDEVNLITRGTNYGYPKVSNGDHYDGRPIPDHSPADGFTPPKVWWNPAISPGGMIVYSGKLFPQWTGDAFIAALGGEALVHVDLDGDMAKKGSEWPLKTRIREVEQGPDGAIWLLEDGEDGRLMKMTPKK
jgi:aldose sugar dehydrogenase